MVDSIMKLATFNRRQKTPLDFHVRLKLPQLSIDKDEFT